MTVEQIVLSHLNYLDNIVKYTEEDAVERPPTPDPYECSFGQWYYGEAQQDAEAKSHPRFDELGELHKKFHQITEDAVDHATKKEYDEAQQLTSEAFALFGKIEHILLEM